MTQINYNQKYDITTVVFIAPNGLVSGANYFFGEDIVSPEFITIPNPEFTQYLISMGLDPSHSTPNLWHSEMPELIFTYYHEARPMEIPKAFSKVLSDVIQHWLDENKSHEGDEQFERNRFDLMQWKGMLDHQVSISISKDDMDSFASYHGVDFPIFVHETNK